MKLDRPLVVLDLEATGPNAATDRIVQVGLVELRPDGSTAEREWLVNPGRPIPAEATAIHGITDAMVADKPPFSGIAEELRQALKGKDLAGFGMFGFDLPLLFDEFAAAGIEWDLTGVRVVDAGMIFKLKHPRTLKDAFMEYSSHVLLGNWHNALVDARATLYVLQGQLDRWCDLNSMSLEQLATFSRGDWDRIDFAGKLLRDKDGDAVFNFGRSKNVKVRDDLGLAYWMLDKSFFSGETKLRVRQEIDRLEEEARLIRAKQNDKGEEGAASEDDEEPYGMGDFKEMPF